MIHQFSPITLGERLKTVSAGGFILTETTHQPDYKLARHNHERTNVAFVLTGSFTEILDRRCIECGPQSLLIKPAGEAHANRYGRAGMRCLLVELEPQQLEALHSWSKVLEGVEHVRGGAVSMLMMRIYKEFRTMDSASPLAIEGLMLEIIAGLSRHFDPRPQRRQIPHWLAEARDFLHAHFARSPGLNRVAETVGVHPVHLAREFRKHFGCTLGEYARRLRVEFAQRELARSGAPLAEIALAAGFSDQAHFSRIFKGHTGLTPSAFRAVLRSR